MASFTTTLTRWLWPELEQLPVEIQANGKANVLTFLYSMPLAVVGLGWLISKTSIFVVSQNWWMFLFLTLLMIALERMSFFVTIETGNGRYASSEGALDSVVLWTGLLLFGPTAAWIAIALQVASFMESWRNLRQRSEQWNQLRNLTMGLASNSLGLLLALTIYQNIGGSIPIGGLDSRSLAMTLGATFAFLIFVLVLFSGFIVYVILNRGSIIADQRTMPILRLVLLAIAIPNLVNPFAGIASGLYVEHGFWTFAFMETGLLLVGVLARRLSMEAEANRQRARQLERLEQLGEELIVAPPDGSTLQTILQNNVPTMFNGRIAIWFSGGEKLLHHPPEWEFELEKVDEYVFRLEQATAIPTGSIIPWDNSQVQIRPGILTPIYDNKLEINIGGIYLELRTENQPWSRANIYALFPPLHSLASQIVSTMHRAEQYSQTLEYHRMSQELSLAGRIQASFLPARMPDLPGWQLAVTLLPARATSGDFFDFIPLGDGKLGVIVADVADKGIGPALYMAISRTLLRTYATQFPGRPDLVLSATNQRILSDAETHLFVTIFYGELDWEQGEMIFANAGHNPPFLLRAKNGVVDELDKTGIPLGIDEETNWEIKSVKLDPGDVLLLYTDGVTEAQNMQEDFFDVDLLLEAAIASNGKAAHEIQAGILESLQNFTGNAPQTDDITLMILRKDSS